MKRKVFFVFLSIAGLIIIAFIISHYFLSNKTEQIIIKTETAVIENFYKEYLARNPEQPNNLSLHFSKSMNELIVQNSKVCSEKAETDICGWGADEDIYLNAQEVDPELNFENSKFKITNPQSGVVNVDFNVFPSLTDKDNYYQRHLQFMLIQENGEWVVDDILYEGKDSVRKKMQDEFNFYLK